MFQDSYVKFINRCVKEHDKRLKVRRDSDGVVRIYVKKKAQVLGYQGNGFTLYNILDTHKYLMGLTHDWSKYGESIQYGSEVVLKRLKEIDLECNPNLLQKMNENNEKVKKSVRKDFVNQTEAFLSDYHGLFKKDWAYTRYANMDMKKDKRRLKDKSIKN